MQALDNVPLALSLNSPGARADMLRRIEHLGKDVPPEERQLMRALVDGEWRAKA